MEWLSFQELTRPLPRIEDRLLKSVIYLYASKDAAESGEPGGSGFLVGVPSAIPETVFLFAVTNRHVAEVCPVVRTAGSPDSKRIFVRQWDGGWHRHPDADDLVVTPIDFAPKDDPDYYLGYVPLEWFVTPENFAQVTKGENELQPQGWPFGPGEEVVMLGRFLAHDGMDQNRPAARFGYLAMAMPVPFEQKRGGIKQLSFVVECRSVTGFSGSPVFIFRPAGLWGGGLLPLGADSSGKSQLPRLLGIDWGNLDRIGPYNYVVDWTEADSESRPWSGMLVAVPAWRLAQLLDSEEVRDVKKNAETEALATKNKVTIDSQKTLS